jgi:hypothetical protein
MKTLWLLAALVLVTAVAAVTACDRRAGPTDGGARAVSGVVELRFASLVRRYDLRVERSDAGFVPALTPLGNAPPAGPELRSFAFVRLAGPGGPAATTVIPTPNGTVTARFAYRPLGPWQVLDRATVQVDVPGLGTAPELQVELIQPRLER